MPHVFRHMPANGCLFFAASAAVRRALVPAADLFAQLPPKGRRLALCGQQLGQQYCPKQKMANSRLKYKRADACAEPEA